MRWRSPRDSARKRAESVRCALALGVHWGAAALHPAARVTEERVMTRGLFWMLGLCGLGCVGQAPEAAKDVGSLSLPLQQSVNGELYRLSGATLAITGAEEHTLEPAPDDTTLQLELSSGDYALELQAGYALERQDGDAWVEVAATLVSDNPLPFVIQGGETTALALRFALDGGPDTEPALGALEVTLEVEPAGSSPGGCAPRLVINELDYDQEGTDTADFAELYNAGDCTLDTAGVVLALINGGAVDAPSYRDVDLTQAGASIAPGQFVVVGRPELAASMPVDTALIAIETFAIQNGSPDGLRLSQADALLDAVTYGGVIEGVTETASTPADGGSGSLGRCPDGLDTGDGSADFAFHATPTPGAPNACP